MSWEGGRRGSQKEGGSVAYWPDSLVDCDGMFWRGVQGGREEERHISEYAPLPPPLKDE